MPTSSARNGARAAVVLVCSFGCAPGDVDERRLGQLVFEDGERPPAPVTAGDSLSAGPLYFAARTAEGAVVVAAADTGEIVDAAQSPDTDLRPVDLVFDPYRARFVAVDDDAEGSLSVARAYGLAWSPSLVPFLEPAVDLGYVEGRLRFAAAPAGLVAFQESYGKRWRLWSESGVPTPSVAAPRPDSVWSTVRADGVFRIGGLAVENDGSIARIEAPVDDAGVGDPSFAAVDAPWADALTVPSARMAVSAQTGQSVLAAVVDGRAWVRPLGDPSGIEPMLLEVSATGVEHVALLRADRIVLLLLSGPTRLVGLYQESPVGMAVLDVPAEVQVADTYFSRELLTLGDDQILVATDRGILSVRLEEGAFGLSLTLQPNFEMPGVVGPLAGPIAPP